MDSLCLCRVCLSNKSLEYIELEAHLANHRTYLDCFNACTQLSATPGDKLPSMICFKCSQDLQQAYAFMTKARKADIALRKRLQDRTRSEKTEEVVEILSPKSNAFLKTDMEIVVIKPLEGQIIDNSLTDEKLEDENPGYITDDYAYCSENEADFILEVHDKDSKTKNETWKCRECKRLFESRISYEDHIDWHKNLCSLKCSKSFLTQNSLEKHSNLRHKTTKHDDVQHSKRYDFTDELVENCEIENSDVDSMEYNKSEDKDKLSLQQECTFCKKKLLGRNMEKHLKLHTIKQENFLCAYCPRHFKSQRTVHQHEKIHFEESEDILYVCVICDRQYSTESLLEQHRKNTHKEREHICTICGNAFKLRNQLTNHMKLHLEKNIQCPHCHKKYVRQFDLNVHLRSHTGEMPYQCHLCEKRFAVKVRLTYHLQKHYGVKHACKECGAEFNSKQKLKAHSFKHTGMPYRCELCDDHGFPNRDVFKRHLLRVHQATISEEALLEMFQRFTGKTTRIREINVSLEEEVGLNQEETVLTNNSQCSNREKKLTD